MPHNFTSNGGNDMRRLVSIFIFAIYSLSSVAQDMTDMEKISKLKGEDSPENLDPYDVEKLEEMLEHPLKLNSMSVSRLKESGLFTHYQAVSFVDYRSRHGDVLSFVELAAVDGFGQDFAERIAPFVSLESHSLPGQAGNRGEVFHKMTARTAAKASAGEGSWNYGIKYNIEVGEYLSGGLSMSRPYDADDLLPESLSGHMRMDFKRACGKVILGDFNARFGQGLMERPGSERIGGSVRIYEKSFRTFRIIFIYRELCDERCRCRLFGKEGQDSCLCGCIAIRRGIHAHSGCQSGVVWQKRPGGTDSLC